MKVSIKQKIKNFILNPAIKSIDADVREAGWDHEVSFWADFVKSDRFFNSWCTYVPNPELEREIHLFVRSIAHRTSEDEGRVAKILDIGSGPVSILSNSFKGLNVQLMAADPLGDEYGKLWDSPLKEKVVTPIACDGESLLEKFGPDVFDVTYIRNALDHTTNPVTTLGQMIAITRPGGYVIAHCFENEADAEGWHGFHQWNIHVANDDYVITGKDGNPFPVFKRIPGITKLLCESSVPPHGRVQCTMIARKIAEK